MSEENVEIVRRIYEAASSGDSAAVYAMYDPAVDGMRLGHRCRD